jgi:hypothetical protein
MAVRGWCAQDEHRDGREEEGVRLRSPRFLAALFATGALLGIAGCGDAQSQQELDLATRSVQVALDAWKRGEMADNLKGQSTPIEFYDDDWQKGAKLIDYQIDQTYRETDGSPRCAVTLTVQHGDRASAAVKVTYQVNTKPKIVIARDPFS